MTPVSKFQQRKPRKNLDGGGWIVYKWELAVVRKSSRTDKTISLI